jgi:hypothetical protein
MRAVALTLLLLAAVGEPWNLLGGVLGLDARPTARVGLPYSRRDRVAVLHEPAQAANSKPLTRPRVGQTTVWAWLDGFPAVFGRTNTMH